MLQNQDVTSLIPVTSFQAHGTYITRVLLSPDVRKLATCSADHNARIWTVTDPSSSQPAANGASLPLQPAGAANFAAAQNGDSHANSNGNSGSSVPLPPDLRKERSPTAFPLEANLGAHQRWVWDCAFSADSAYLVTACSDHYARLWELSSQSIIRQYNGHHRGAVCVALNDYSDSR